MSRHLCNIIFIILNSILALSAQDESFEQEYKSTEEIRRISDSLLYLIPIDINQVKSLLSSSKRLNYSIGLINCHSILGENYRVLDSMDRAKYHFEKKLEQARLMDNKFEESKALGQMAQVLNSQNEVAEASRLSYLQLKIAKELEDSLLLCNSYLTLFEIHNMGLHFDSEIKYLNLALDHHTSENREYSKGYLYTMLGSVYYSKEEYENSLEQFEKARMIFVQLSPPNEYDEAYFNVHFGQLLIELDSVALGIEYLEKAKIYFERLRSSQMIAECLSSLLEAYHILGKNDKVKSVTKSLETLVQKFNTPYVMYLLNRGKYISHNLSTEDGLDTIVNNFISSTEDLLFDENNARIYETEKQLKIKEKKRKMS